MMLRSVDGGGRRRPPQATLPVLREDFWSEEETAVLVEAWGKCFVALNRGNIRQQHWREVADLVNACPAAGRRGIVRSDVQCKNRIDTVKKRYKAERARLLAGGESSDWRFYGYLDSLLGSTGSPSNAADANGVKVKSPPSSPSRSVSLSPSPPMRLPPPFYNRQAPLPSTLPMALDNDVFRSAAAAAAAAAANGFGSKLLKNAPTKVTLKGSSEENEVESRSAKRQRLEGQRVDGMRSKASNGLRELTKAIEKFAEVYVKIEEAKQQHEDEMERERMEFLKNIEMQRMRFIVDSHKRLRELKDAKSAAVEGCLAPVDAMPLLSSPAFF